MYYIYMYVSSLESGLQDGVHVHVDKGAKLGKIQGGWRGNPRFGSIFKRVYFLAFLRKGIKKDLYLR